MDEIVIRNPVARWGQWLGLGILVLVFVLSDNTNADCYTGNCTTHASLLLTFSPLWGGLFIAAAVSAWTRLTLEQQGLRVRSVFGTKFYPWREISDMRVVKVRKYTNNVRTGTVRHVDIRHEDKWRKLPAPRAGLLLGAGAFDRSARQIWAVWRNEPVPRVQDPRSAAR